MTLEMAVSTTSNTLSSP